MLQRRRSRAPEGPPSPPPPLQKPITTPSQDRGPAPQSPDPACHRWLTTPPGKVKGHDPDDLSACSDLESGVAGLSSRSSSGCDYGRDPDSDEGASSSA